MSHMRDDDYLKYELQNATGILWSVTQAKRKSIL